MPAGEPVSEVDDDSFRPGLLPFAASLFPGAVLHGSGHFAAGDRDTAYRLLAAEAAGAGMFIGGLGALALTGAGEKSSPPAIIISVTGVSLFFISWASDIYGSSGGTGGLPAAPGRFTFEAGITRVEDPLFLYKNLFRADASAWYEKWRISLEHLRALDDDNHYTRTVMCRRLAGAASGSSAADGSFIEAAAAGSYHHYGSEYFDLYTAEFFFAGRYDLARFSRSLRGSFTGASLGYGLGIYEYDVPGYVFGEDKNDMLLMRFEYGIYIGRGSGEAALFYDHRRDTYAGGLKGGFMGFAGISTEYFFNENSGISGELMYGTALVINISLKFRG
jgi:hypothetical protein